MVIRPTAAAPAASDPEIAANMPQTSTVADPNPPLAQQVSASATSRNFRLRPVRTSTSPVRMNSGTAVSAKASIPENSFSPSKPQRQRAGHHQHGDRGRTYRSPDRHRQCHKEYKQNDRSVEIPAKLKGLGGSVAQIG